MSATERMDRTAKSGKALDQLNEDQQVSTYHFFNSWKMATQREGRIKERLLGKIEAKNGRVGVRDIKGKYDMVDRTPEMVTARHSVIISTGKAYQSQQQQTKDLLDALMHSGDPSMQLAAAPNLIRMMDFGPMGEILAAELEAIQPPPMQQARLQVSGKGPDPKQQLQMANQQLQQMHGAIQQMQQKLVVLENEKHAKTIEMQSRERMEADRNKTALLQTIITTSSKEDLAHLELTSETMASKMDQMYQMLDGAQQRAHELTTQGMDQEHQQAMQDSQQNHEATTQMADQAHQQGMQTQQLTAQQQQPEAAAANQGANE
jgi:hypothetical protein